MNRWVFLKLSVALLISVCMAPVAQAQIFGIDGTRKFPLDAERGKLEVVRPPLVKLNGKEEILPPGVRIVSLTNTLVGSAYLAGTTYTVNYRRDDWGQLREIWLLNDKEAKLPIKKDPSQAKPMAQRSLKFRQRPLGNNVPYDQLPSYEQSTGAQPN